jgi:hypothetical protein
MLSLVAFSEPPNGSTWLENALSDRIAAKTNAAMASQDTARAYRLANAGRIISLG